MSKKVGIKERIKYEFENTLSKGTIAIIGWLALVSLLIVILAGTIITVGHLPPIGCLLCFRSLDDTLLRGPC